MKAFTKAILLSIAVLTVTASHAQHTLTRLWETDTLLNIPESVLPEKDVMYVSLIDGEPWGIDGKGEVGKLTRTGKILSTSWITGLNAPKGLARNGDLLYVADMNELVVISISGNRILNKIKVNGAAGLNDVTIAADGTVYVTDTKKNCVFQVNGGSSIQYLDNLVGANGIKSIGKKLYILTSDGMYVSESGGKPSKICILEHGGDGIEPIGNGDFLVTAWEGWVYYVHADGAKEVLLDTHTTRRKTADIGYDPARRIVYVPTFSGKSVVAYRLN